MLTLNEAALALSSFETMFGKHLVGKGGLAVNKVAALGYYTKAANQGYSLAQYSAAVLHYNGQGGVQRDYQQALYYMQLAVDQGGWKARSAR